MYLRFINQRGYQCAATHSDTSGCGNNYPTYMHRVHGKCSTQWFAIRRDLDYYPYSGRGDQYWHRDKYYYLVYTFGYLYLYGDQCGWMYIGFFEYCSYTRTTANAFSSCGGYDYSTQLHPIHGECFIKRFTCFRNMDSDALSGHYYHNGNRDKYCHLRS